MTPGAYNLRSTSRPWSLLGLLVLGALLCLAGGALRAATLKEQQLKAAFIYNMLKFVEWPPQSFANPSAPFIVGVLNEDDLRQELETVVKDRNINGRGIVVKAVANVEEASSVHLLFAPENDQQLALMWPRIRQLPILTVGESGAFVKIGGAIRFTRIGDKLRFEVNVTSAERAGLKISAQLQKLAISIRREP